jgi:hypothetical protein
VKQGAFLLATGFAIFLLFTNAVAVAGDKIEIDAGIDKTLQRCAG